MDEYDTPNIMFPDISDGSDSGIDCKLLYHNIVLPSGD